MFQLSETNYSSIKVPNLITLTQQHEGTNNPTIHYLNKNPNVIMKNNKLIKAIAGFSHILCLFNNGDIFTNIHHEIINNENTENEEKEEEDSIIRGEVGTNTIDFHQPTITNITEYNFYLAGDQFLTLILDRINNGEDEEMKFKRKLISCVTDMELKFK
ncbi:hypothetical protein ABK040_007492 [Willaertia magna]